MTSLLTRGLMSRLLGQVLDVESEESAGFRRGKVGVSRLPVSEVSGYEGNRKDPGGVELEGSEKVRSILRLLDRKPLVLDKPF